MKLLKVLLFVFITSIVIAQEKKTNEESNLIEQQFETLYKKSSSYQKYKVIDKQAYTNLKRTVLNSIKNLESIINSKQGNISKNETELTSLKNEIIELNKKLDTSIKQEKEISFLGIKLIKTNYNLIVWCIIIILAVLLVFFIYRFKNSNAVTKSAKISFEEIEQEFEQHKKKSLEKEQKLRRKLQDEINKQRGV